MATPRNLTNAEKEMIRPNLIASLDPDSVEYADILLEEQVCDSYPDGIHLITIPVEGYPAMQFYADTGEFAELTDWSYVVDLDVDAQIAEMEHQDEVETIICALKHYLKPDYHLITDFEKVVNDREELTVNDETLFKYECPCQTIYLQEDNYPITYDKQVVTEDTYYYNFNEDADNEIDNLTYSVPYEWMRNEDIWH